VYVTVAAGVTRRIALFYGVVDSERRYEPCQLPLRPRRAGTFFSLWLSRPHCAPPRVCAPARARGSVNHAGDHSVAHLRAETGLIVGSGRADPGRGNQARR